MATTSVKSVRSFRSGQVGATVTKNAELVSAFEDATESIKLTATLQSGRGRMRMAWGSRRWSDR